jgi:hypothetical protein
MSRPMGRRTRRDVKKVVYRLNLGNAYAPELTALTYPHLEKWAEKIGAEVYTITERKFPTFDPDIEKLQIFDLSRERGDDWSIYIDSDALVHPELPDITTLIPRDTVAHNGADFAGIRWKYDDYLRRDGRNIGSCCWLMVASDWCRDMFRPLDDMTFEEAVANITVTIEERHAGVTPGHLITDYVVSRNIARFGLKFLTLNDLWPKLGLEGANFFSHEYTIPVETKIEHIKQTIEKWRL